ncbi:thiol:disulfide interchange protein DsbD [Pedobacter glucosidilyticus]|nr:thiol:disulfide interchange protein DsbD [Pedobacter glucosidilyticus]
MLRFLLVVFFCLGVIKSGNAQEITWLSFEQLDDSLKVKPKPVIISFYTDWCVYCKKMDKEVYSKTAVIKEINQHYYAVKFDAETKTPIHFDGKTFHKKSQFHELALLLGAREKQFTPPVILILDSNFVIKSRWFEYLSSDKLLEILKTN